MPPAGKVEYLHLGGLFCFLWFQTKSLYIPGCPGIFYVAQVVLELSIILGWLGTLYVAQAGREHSM